MPQSNSLEARSDTARSPKKEKSIGSSDPASSPERNKPMRKAHFVLQGKGGVGKTFVASLIAQYLTERGEPVACLDKTSFVPMSRYLVQDGVVEAILSAGKQVVIHTIVAGGPELVHTG